MVTLLDFSDPASCRAYEAFVSSHQNGQFMHALAWTTLKNHWTPIVLISKTNAGQINGTLLVLMQKLPFIRGTFFYAPRGPVCDYDDVRTLHALFRSLASVASTHHACLFRMDPCIVEENKQLVQLFTRFGFVHKPHAPEFSTVQPRNHYVLPLTGHTEETLLNSFHQKWRYNIRLAQRKGVVCKPYGLAHLPDFYALMKETGQRDGFSVRSEDYFRTMLTAFGDNARLYLCYHNDIPLSGAIAIQYAGKTSYLYGASSSNHRSLMPNYLMQWTMMQWALAANCREYDFMGIPHYDDPKHPNYGVFRFKQGFRGEVRTHAGEFDLYYRPVLARGLIVAEKLMLHHARCQRERRAWHIPTATDAKLPAPSATS